MKNFPHQANNLNVLKSALQVAADLISNGEDLLDVEMYGEELVRKKVYKYRKKVSISKYLISERKKSRSGYKTAAQEHRRFFELLGFIKFKGRKYQITSTGKRLLRIKESGQIFKLWHTSLMSMELSDSNGNISNPYKIMVDLILAYPGIKKEKLCLPFECKNNNDIEFQRIQNFIHTNFKLMIKKLNVKKGTAKNVTYVLPTIGVQIGDFVLRGNEYRPSEQLIYKYQSDILQTDDVSDFYVKNIFIKDVSYDKVAEIPKNISETCKKYVDSIVNSQNKIKYRFISHQILMTNFAELLKNSGFKLKKNNFDCLAYKNGTYTLIEAKTILNNYRDQRKQSEKVIGQINGYLHFDLKNYCDIHSTKLVVLYNRRPLPEIRKFMAEFGIIPIWYSQTSKNFKIYIEGKINLFKVDYIC